MHIWIALLPRFVSEYYKPTGDVNRDMRKSCVLAPLLPYPARDATWGGRALPQLELLSPALVFN
jgi:hypothetical protein